jgi:hypothetical protein
MADTTEAGKAIEAIREAAAALHGTEPAALDIYNYVKEIQKNAQSRFIIN